MGLYVVRFLCVLVVCQLEKSLLIRVANVLLIAENPPEHGYQALAVALHGREYPPLAFVDRLNTSKIPRQ